MKQGPPDPDMNRDRTVIIGIGQVTCLYRFHIPLCSAIGLRESIVIGAKPTRETYNAYENIQL
jgi:hypothetical protein